MRGNGTGTTGNPRMGELNVGAPPPTSPPCVLPQGMTVRNHEKRTGRKGSPLRPAACDQEQA